MALTVNYGSKYVISDASITDAVAFHEALRDIEVSETGILYPAIHTYKEIQLGGGAIFPAIAFINGWTLQFGAGNYELSGGNYDLTINPVANCYVRVTQSAAYAVSASLAGFGQKTVNGTGACTSGTVTVYGSDWEQTTFDISAALEASVAGLAGTGSNYLNGTGECLSGVSGVASTGTVTPLVIVTGSGWLLPAPVTVEGTATRGFTFSAELLTSAPRITSTAGFRITGAGELTVSTPILRGTGYLAKETQANLQASPAEVSGAIHKTINGNGNVVALPSALTLQWLSSITSHLQAGNATVFAYAQVNAEEQGFEVFASMDEFNDFIISGGQARVLHNGTGELTANGSVVNAIVHVEPANADNQLIIGRGLLANSPAVVGGAGTVRVLGQLEVGYLEAGRSTVTARLHIMDFSDPDKDSIVVLPTDELIVVLPINEFIETAA